MSTISAASAASVYAYNPAANSNVSAALAQSAATQLSVINTLVSLGGNNSSSPLTYSAAGLFGPPQQTAANASSNVQAVQNAYPEVQYAVSQTLSSLVSGTSSSSSSSDIASLFNLAGAPDANNLSVSPTGSLLNTSTGSASAQAAQFAAINAQYALTQALGSLTSSSSSISTTA